MDIGLSGCQEEAQMHFTGFGRLAILVACLRAFREQLCRGSGCCLLRVVLLFHRLTRARMAGKC